MNILRLTDEELRYVKKNLGRPTHRDFVGKDVAQKVDRAERTGDSGDMPVLGVGYGRFAGQTAP